jgi:hypothetical protein
LQLEKASKYGADFTKPDLSLSRAKLLGYTSQSLIGPSCHIDLRILSSAEQNFL